MSQIWSAATILRFENEGEQEIAKALNCLLARVSIPVILGTPLYSLPDDLITVSRITYRGKKLDPMPQRDFEKVNVFEPQSRPLFYIFNNQGKNTIRFYPVPDETIAPTTDDNDLFGVKIIDHVICQYWQLPGSGNGIPLYIRRRILKLYTLMRCFEIEGKGQNLKAAKRFKDRYQFYLGWFKKIHANHYVAKMSVLGTGNKRGILAPPRLPYTFGESGEF